MVDLFRALACRGGRPRVQHPPGHVQRVSRLHARTHASHQTLAPAREEGVQDLPADSEQAGSRSARPRGCHGHRGDRDRAGHGGIPPGAALWHLRHAGVLPDPTGRAASVTRVERKYVLDRKPATMMPRCLPSESNGGAQNRTRDLGIMGPVKDDEESGD